MANSNDFVIEKGKLTKYTGTDLDVVIPGTVTYIGRGVFKGKHLSSIRIPSTVTKIGMNPIGECDESTKLYFDGTVAEWCSIQFTTNPISFTKNIYINNKLLTEIKFEDLLGIDAIYGEAFRHCECLKSVSIPGNIKAIGSNAFAYCSNLKSVNLQTGIKTFGNHCFGDCNNIESVNFDGSIKDWLQIEFHYGGNPTVYTKGLKINDQYVTEIKEEDLGNIDTVSDQAFKAWEHLEKVELPDSIKRINVEAFDGCVNLKSVKFSNRLTEINHEAFRNCKSLSSLIFPEGLRVLNRGAFNGCDLDYVRWPASLNEVHEYAIEHVKKLEYEGSLTAWMCICLSGCGIYLSVDTELTIGGKVITELTEKDLDGMTYISPRKFRCFSSLTSVSIPNTVDTIGEEAFSCCINLTHVKLPNGLKKIPNGLFRSCKSLKEIDIPDSVTVIGANAFRDCCALTSVIISENVKEIGACCFVGDENINEIQIPDVDKIGSDGADCFWDDHKAFGDCKNIRTAGPAGGGYDLEFGWKTHIPANAFRCFSNLQSVVIPDTVTSIGDNAFDHHLPLVIYRGKNGIFTHNQFYSKYGNIEAQIFMPNVMFSDIPKELRKNAVYCMIEMCRKEHISESVMSSYLEYLNRQKKHYYDEFSKNHNLLCFFTGNNLVPKNHINEIQRSTWDKFVIDELEEYRKKLSRSTPSKVKSGSVLNGKVKETFIPCLTEESGNQPCHNDINYIGFRISITGKPKNSQLELPCEIVMIEKLTNSNCGINAGDMVEVSEAAVKDDVEYHNFSINLSDTSKLNKAE